MTPVDRFAPDASAIDFAMRISPRAAAQDSAKDESRAYFVATCLLMLVVLWFIDHDFARMGHWDETIGQTAEDAATIHGTEWASGETARRLAFPVAAAWGVALAVWAPGRRVVRPRNGLTLLFAALTLFCFVSVLWSDEPVATLKKLFSLGCALAAAAGVGLTIRPRQLCLMVTLVTSLYGLLALSGEVAAGVFQPWHGEYRLSGTLHPNYLGAYVGAACIGSFCLWRYAGRAPWWAANGLLMFALTVLTKSRMALLALLIALLFVQIGRRSRAGMATVITYLMTAAACIALLAGLTDRALQRSFLEVILLNRLDEVGSLTGRTPLWRELVPHVAERPLLGHGFAGFWTTDRYAEVAAEIGWPAAHAHCAYLGAALEIGLIGMTLWAAIVLLATWTAAQRFRRTSDSGDCFLLGMGVFVVLLSATETMFFMVNGLNLLLGPAIVLLASEERGEDRR